MGLKGFKPTTLIIIVGIVAVICLFSVFGGGLGRLFRGDNQPGVGNLPNTGRQLPNSGRTVQSGLGRLYTALEVDRNGCPVQPANEFYSDETIYVGLEESNIPQGTDMFMRLLYEGDPVEDADAIHADRDMQTCVWFQFQPTTADGFRPGNYQAQLFVNGNPSGSISFQVAGGRSSQGGNPGNLPNSSANDIQLGRVMTTSQIDQNGCPVESVSNFYTDEPVYIAVTNSYIPEGTEIFARLVRDGQSIEDSDPITADREMETCVWFEFGSSSSSGLEPGQYEIELYVNGQIAEIVSFSVG